MARHDFRKSRLEQVNGKPHIRYYIRKYGPTILHVLLIIETLVIIGYMQGCIGPK